MPDRDELLRQIGEKVVGRVDERGLLSVGGVDSDLPYRCWCPFCGDPDDRWAPGVMDYWHTDDCEIAEQLEVKGES